MVGKYLFVDMVFTAMPVLRVLKLQLERLPIGMNAGPNLLAVARRLKNRRFCIFITHSATGGQVTSNRPTRRPSVSSSGIFYRGGRISAKSGYFFTIFSLTPSVVRYIVRTTMFPVLVSREHACMDFAGSMSGSIGKHGNMSPS